MDLPDTDLVVEYSYVDSERIDLFAVLDRAEPMTAGRY
jgi:hypothetical protein